MERELRLKDKELDRMRVERDNLKDSDDILKQKVSKKNHVDRKTLKKLVTEREEKIKKLQREKNSLNDAFEVSDKRYQELQQKMALVKGIAKHYEAIIDQLKDKLSKQDEDNNRQQSSCTSHCCRAQQAWYNMCMVLIVISIFILLIVGYSLTCAI